MDKRDLLHAVVDSYVPNAETVGEGSPSEIASALMKVYPWTDASITREEVFNGIADRIVEIREKRVGVSIDTMLLVCTRIASQFAMKVRCYMRAQVVYVVVGQNAEVSFALRKTPEGLFEVDVARAAAIPNSNLGQWFSAMATAQRFLAELSEESCVKSPL